MSDPSAAPGVTVVPQTITTAPAPVDAPAPDVPARPVAEEMSAEAYRAMKTEEEVAAGEEVRKIPVREEEFRVAGKLPGIVLLDLGLASDPTATQGEQLRAIRQFLHAAIFPDDVERFEVFLRRAEPVIEMEELNKIVEELITMVAGRPTE